MPEMTFRVRWPDDSTTLCYSPSSTIREAFVIGEGYPVPEFVARSRAALEHASARVAQKYGYGCAHAQRQIEEIESQAAAFANRADARITVEAFS
jgi:uncharacterized repeat protein (TIGR04042 family)